MKNSKSNNNASFFGYENGNSGPSFIRADGLTKLPDKTDWPVWVDRLETDNPSRLEGGLRIYGKLKTGKVDMPLVTYVTVVRNNIATLERTIKSVQKQTYLNVEHIVIDGASTDGTIDIILRHASHIDYFVSEVDNGLYDALNKAISLARGQLICVLNSDDWLEPNAAAIAIKYMNPSNVNSLLLSSARVQEGSVVHQWQPAFINPGSYFLCANACHNAIYASRDAYERSGPYDSSYKIAADFKWIMTCMDAGTVISYTKEATVNYSLGGASGDFLKHSEECMRVVQERFPFLTIGEIRGLYHSFFVFSNATKIFSLDRPPNITIFLREIWARYSDKPDFLLALGWASIVKLNHPTDSIKIEQRNIYHFIKAAMKKRLIGRPVIYAVVRWVSVKLFQRL
ncbi:MAG: glycosyltransferase family 2 protein [Nitrosospira sp.]|nr:glycosyltransferase family 2 protein [Nitrosospira sp.]